MRAWVRPLIVAIAVMFVPLPAWSVIVKTKDGKEYKGHLTKTDTFKVIIRLHGSDEEKSFFKLDILELVQPVQPQELEKLKPADPKKYMEYGLGLMGQVQDPEAHETALRLLLITAYLDPITHGHSALLKMSEIARSTEEASAFRAMAFLLDVVADKGTLKKTNVIVNEDVKARDAFLKSLEMLRRGLTKDALKYASTKGTAEYFGLIPGLMPYDEFVKICKENPECGCKEGRVFCAKCVGKGAVQGTKGLTLCTDCKGKGFNLCKECKGKPRKVKLTPLQWQIMLQLELLSESDPKGKLDSPGEVKSEKWSALLSGSQIQPIPVLSLIHLTEFDPRKCVYKNGKWVEP